MNNYDTKRTIFLYFKDKTYLYLKYKNVFMTYHRVCNKSTTGATSGTKSAYPCGSHEFNPVCSGVRVAQSLVFGVKFCRSLLIT